ncbi:MAG: MATE family efflux transporter [FCB group bacterium]|nr:MATE family efflux transporter [FCB group bacterium]
MKTRVNIVSGSIPKTIFTLAIPVVLGMFMEFALSTTDYYWVGKLGASAQDAITSSMVIIWTIFALISIISVGITAMVSRYVGANDLSKVSFYIKQGIALAIMLGVLFSIIGFIATPYLLNFMDTGQETFVQAVPYLKIFFATAIFFVWAETVYAVFRASGDTKTPTIVGVISILINMILDPLLIFGVGPFPKMGVSGASLATAIAISISTLIITLKMYHGKLGYKIDKLFHIKPQLKPMLRITRIGIPASTQQMVFIVVYWFLIKIVHTFGDTAGAAMGIGNRMESFSYLTCYGFSVAASTMVGQNLGAHKPDRASKCAWGSAGTAIGITFIISILFVAFPKLIASVFTDNPEVLKIAIDYLIILGLSQMAMAVEIVLEGAFAGAGDTIPPMVVMIPLSLARVPLAYYLAFNLEWGINGVWWTLTITSLLKAVLLAFWFKRGKWKEKEV